MPDERLEELNTIYHRNILYDADSTIQNLLFQTYELDFCFRKFKDEAHSYINGQPYKPLNLDDAQHQMLYDELNAILASYKIPYACRDITARIKKLFCSCCDYHCAELLRSIKNLCSRESQVIKAPILHIVYVLRRSLSKEDLKEIILQDHLTVNWELMPAVEFEQPEIYLVSLDREEINILNVLAEQFDAIYAKADLKHYYVRFKTVDAFNAFKKYALELSQPYYVFEGDVQKVIRVKREYHNIVELDPLDSFDITNTLAKFYG